MPKVKNISGDDRTVPALDGVLVKAGETVDVPDAKPFACQADLWSLVKEK